MSEVPKYIFLIALDVIVIGSLFSDIITSSGLLPNKRSSAVLIDVSHNLLTNCVIEVVSIICVVNNPLPFIIMFVASKSVVSLVSGIGLSSVEPSPDPYPPPGSLISSSPTYFTLPPHTHSIKVL